MVASNLMITHAEFTERVIPSGGVLQFTVTVKNISEETIAGGTDAPPGFEYTQGVAYDALGYFPENNTYRIGLSFAWIVRMPVRGWVIRNCASRTAAPDPSTSASNRGRSSG